MNYFIIGASFCHFIEAARIVRGDLGIVPKIWTVHPRILPLIQNEFSDTIVLNAHDLTCAATEDVMQKAGINSRSMVPLSPAWQERMGTWRSFVLENLLHRSDYGGCYTLQEMVYTVNQYFLIGYNLIKKFKPKLIVYVVAPHTMYDLALYFVARELGIKNLMFTDSPAPNISYATEDFLNLHPFLSFPKNLRINEHLKEEIFEECINSRKTEKPFYMKPGDYLGRSVYGRKNTKIIVDLFLLFLKKTKGRLYQMLKLTVENHRRSRERWNYQKLKGRLLADKTVVDGWRFKKAVGNAKLEIYYNNLTRDFSMNSLQREGAYVYLPLSFQPERSTMPCAGFMYDQFTYIQMLAAALPNGWKIIAKENPKQFLDNRGGRVRDLSFYRMLTRIGVSFAPLDFCTHELTKRSLAVVVTTGTAGFEARVIHRKPVLAFSESWYSGIPGVSVVKTWEDLVDAIEEISTGAWDDDEASLNEHLEYLKEQAIYFHPNERAVARNGGDLEAMGRNLARLIQNQLPKF